MTSGFFSFALWWFQDAERTSRRSSPGPPRRSTASWNGFHHTCHRIAAHRLPSDLLEELIQRLFIIIVHLLQELKALGTGKPPDCADTLRRSGSSSIRSGAEALHGPNCRETNPTASLPPALRQRPLFREVQSMAHRHHHDGLFAEPLVDATHEIFNVLGVGCIGHAQFGQTSCVVIHDLFVCSGYTGTYSSLGIQYSCTRTRSAGLCFTPSFTNFSMASLATRSVKASEHLPFQRSMLLLPCSYHLAHPNASAPLTHRCSKGQPLDVEAQPPRPSAPLDDR